MTAFCLPTICPVLFATLNSPVMWYSMSRAMLHGKDEALRLKTDKMQLESKAYTYYETGKWPIRRWLALSCAAITHRIPPEELTATTFYSIALLQIAKKLLHCFGALRPVTRIA
jgi:hypothetical protein